MIEQMPEVDRCLQAGTADEALELAAGAPIDLAIVDISLSGTSGIDLTVRLISKYPNLPILVLSMFDESLYLERAFRAGAKGYIMKQEATERLLLAVAKLLRGDVYVSDKMQGVMLQRFVRRDEKEPISFVEHLSAREFEVLRLIGQGLSTSDISLRLSRSVKTIEAHRASIKEKLQLKSATDLSRFATQWVESDQGA